MNFFKKWYIYQKERFPILIYGLYVFCIVFGVFCFCNYHAKIAYESMIQNVVFCRAPDSYIIYWTKLIPMFIVAFLQFFMVRIIDEFKDYDEDCKFRPYRPVPRGLIKLKELKILFIICAILQVVITAVFNKIGLVLLLVLWLYFALMSKEFFLKKAIDKHILLGVFLDELLMPVLVLYLASYIYLGVEIWKILLMSYFISWIVEIARKIRCKEDEEKGVKTYTAVFGIKKAILLLWVLEAIVATINIFILQKTYITVALFVAISLINLVFVIEKKKWSAKVTELSANIGIMLAYLSMGILVTK